MTVLFSVINFVLLVVTVADSLMGKNCYLAFCIPGPVTV